MTSQPIYCPISHKDNETMKFGELIKHQMRNIFSVKSYTKCGGKTSPSLFSKKPKLSIPLDQQYKVLDRLFLLYAKLRAVEIY